jgi:hypothetical protein
MVRWTSVVCFLGFGLLAAEVGAFEVNNASFVLVSGFPQSGTTLVTRILAALGATSMNNRCDELNGKFHCHQFNYEGQWLLGASGRAIMQPGSMCPLSPSAPVEGLRKILLNDWGKYWATNRSAERPESTERIYLQKAPQDMLKIPMLRDVFNGAGARSSRFVVVLKHPMTVNYNRKLQWAAPKRIKENIAIVKHYLDRSIRDDAAVRAGCEEGNWFQVMERLHTQLVESAASINDVLVVHFEETAMPEALCRKMVTFIGNGHGSLAWTVTALKTCASLFRVTLDPHHKMVRKPPMDSSSNDALGRGIPRFGGQGHERGGAAKRRQLGLKEMPGDNESKVWINSDISGTEPLRTLIAALGKLSAAERAQLDAYEGRLRKYGYSLQGSRTSHTREDVLRPWSGR